MLEVSRESGKSAVLASWAGSVEAEEEQEGGVLARPYSSQNTMAFRHCGQPG